MNSEVAAPDLLIMDLDPDPHIVILQNLVQGVPCACLPHWRLNLELAGLNDLIMDHNPDPHIFGGSVFTTQGVP